MNKLIGLLDEKNTYLEKFLGLNRDWLTKLDRGDFGDLEKFRENRETILNIVKHIDTLIDEDSRQMANDDVNEMCKTRIHSLLGRKDALVKAILAQDLEIMQIIDAAKSQVIEELKNVSRGRRSLQSYRMPTRKDSIDEEV